MAFQRIRPFHKMMGGKRRRLSEKGKAFTAQEQPKQKPAQEAATFDASVSNLKAPASDLDTDVRIATVGETVPIVFGKRVSSKGGIWVAPPLLKTASTQFKGQFLYAISQGEVSSSPAKITTWAGLRCLAFIDDQTITLANKYSTAASLASTPGSCPIQGNGLYCGVDSYSYLAALSPATASASWISRLPDQTIQYYGYRVKSFGTGDTANLGFTATVQMYDSETGADITSAYFTYLGVPSSTQYGFNWNLAYLNNPSGGADPTLSPNGINDWIQDAIDDGVAGGLEPPINATTVAAGKYTQSELNDWNAISGGRGAFTEKWTVVAVTTPFLVGGATSTGTLTGVQYEYVVSDVAEPGSTSVGYNSSYADITFLEVNGDIYPAPSAGSFPTTTEQLYVFYEQGIKVDLYSAGLSSGSYTNAASNQFIDLAMYLFALYKRTAGSTTADIVAPVYLDNLVGLSTFCTTYSLHFNGIISQSVNIVEYISSIAPFYFLSFLSNGGRYQFASVLPLNGSNAIDVTALTPTKAFTEADILPGSFEKGYLSVEDRREFIASCVYRKSEPGEIGAQRTVSVKYPATSIDAPTEQFDLSSCCIDSGHAAMYAKYELARRKYSTHNISFSTPLSTTTLIPTNIIKITRQRKSSTVDADRTEVEWYQITKVSHTASGETQIEASHFPVNGSSISEISNEVLNGTFTVLT